MDSTQQSTDVLVVGSGVAGLIAASELLRAGRSVIVVDKGRGVGGRLASRRIAGTTFDHGAQGFTTGDSRCSPVGLPNRLGGAVAEWMPDPSHLTGGLAHWRGVPCMSGVAKHLARGIDVQLETTLVDLRAEAPSWIATARRPHDSCSPRPPNGSEPACGPFRSTDGGTAARWYRIPIPASLPAPTHPSPSPATGSGDPESKQPPSPEWPQQPRSSIAFRGRRAGIEKATFQLRPTAETPTTRAGPRCSALNAPEVSGRPKTGIDCLAQDCPSTPRVGVRPGTAGASLPKESDRRCSAPRHVDCHPRQ